MLKDDASSRKEAENLEEFKAVLNDDFEELLQIYDVKCEELAPEEDEIDYTELELADEPADEPEDQEGLTAERIERFERFTSPDAKCAICKEDFTIGTELTRLDCSGKHVFCAECISNWFSISNKKTCPLYRHSF